MRTQARTLLVALVLAGPLSAEPAPLWKDYANTRVGVQLRVQSSWQQIELKDGPQTGMVAFNLSQKPDPFVSLSVQRQKVDIPFADYTSPEILDQLFQPGYVRTKTEFAGRSCVKVVGLGKDDGRRQESYYSSQPPFIDDITFAAPPENWKDFAPELDAVKKTIRWTR